MKSRIVSYILGALLFVGCSENEGPDNAREVKVVATATMSEFEAGNEDGMPETRSSVNWGTKDGAPYVTFSWDREDVLGVFADRGENTLMRFAVTGQAQSEVAYFSCENFNLGDASQAKYYGFCPYEKVWNQDREEIKVTYAGQNQTANKNTDHLGAYDYQAAYVGMDANRMLDFNFVHLGAILRVRMGFTGFEETEKHTFNKLELVRADNTEIPYERIIDLTASKEEGLSYKPSITTEKAPATGGPERRSFVLNLGKYNETTQEYDGIEVGKYKSTSDFLVMYLMLPATNEMDGEDMYCVLTDKDTKQEYFMPMKGMELLPGKYYSVANNNCPPTGTLSMRIKVAKKWQQGETVLDTRAVGDPGLNDVLTPPDHLYIYVCKDNKYYLTKTIKEGDVDWKGWHDNGNEWLYNEDVTVNMSLNAPTDNMHAFIAASVGELNPKTAGLTQEVTEESVVEAASFDTTNNDDGQTFLKNVYSAHKRVNKDVLVMDIDLYHVATKLDVQWNNTTPTKLSGSVSVSGLPYQNLRLFGPTSSSADWAPSVTIDEGTCWNGRTVFYVPNISSGSYTITTGTGSQAVSFSAPSSDDKGAWWRKANITIR